MRLGGVGLAASGRRPRRRLSTRLGFLETSRFAVKTPEFARWKSLDFLGFSRQNRDLSMGYAGFSLKNFSWPFSPPGVRSGGHEGRRRGYAEQKGS
jgi:hypothetical protein